ncbi:oleoyl-acyl carrier protein thioesterase 1, chloroplastic [Brassica rapa]|uniref:oleoyl-acyl carrier protein thioesterase 1, chloroplastic n=1 Tax=Brassica campestris TaxID=3711 RepID=UPI00142D7E93|nr:oleoyl-acyl carrier protein thioesterase 1, chloroplastic [Brassica rapa]XP_009149150.2 oleoyl-acyl carrier protein thioesterase 1, chloroplastic [Brassica rapa]XP_013660291.2 oleoyl-acyl carrier protein thioesterase 1, chloroplastic-like [Brassica napus]XP_013660292.2 oleoyl-acyl carrier protein thioesterase 1, chloroplastic-like [Brassica napus]XP_022547324.2 oleoyl-acyl carrier protein thioesterase 1, chloroplastic-like [Brassica napus]
MHIEIYRYPAWGDVVEIETWCQSEGRIGTRRDWILKDIANAEVTGRATRLAFPEEENNRSLKKIPTLEDLAKYSIIGLKPRRADLDMNHHVNNFTYIGWILESILKRL